MSTLAVPAQTQEITQGTSVVVALTEVAVVMGADHLREITNPADLSQRRVVLEAIPKFHLCGPGVVCATVGWAEASIDCEGAQVKYIPSDWLPVIKEDSGTGEVVGPEQIAHTIWQKAQTTFRPLECFMRTEKGQRMTLDADGPVMFLVAGYSPKATIPQYFAIRVQFDRERRRLLFPAPEQVFPKGTGERLPQVFFAGEKDNILAAYAEKEPQRSRFLFYLAQRKARADLLLQGSPAQLRQAVAAVAAYLDVESEFSDKVGGGSSVMVVRQGHPAQIVFMPELNAADCDHDNVR